MGHSCVLHVFRNNKYNTWGKHSGPDGFGAALTCASWQVGAMFVGHMPQQQGTLGRTDYVRVSKKELGVIEALLVMICLNFETFPNWFPWIFCLHARRGGRVWPQFLSDGVIKGRSLRTYCLLTWGPKTPKSHCTFSWTPCTHSVKWRQHKLKKDFVNQYSIECAICVVLHVAVTSTRSELFFYFSDPAKGTTFASGESPETTVIL